jgi:hypothetical protein
MANTTGQLVAVDFQKCREVAAVLASHIIPAAIEEGLEILTLPPCSLANFYLLAVAICHQTSPIGLPRLGGRLGSGERAWGWDYLRRRLAERVREDGSIIDPASWRSMNATELVRLLEADDGPVHLTDPERRAALIRDAGCRMLLNGWHGVSALYEEEDGWLLRDGRGILVRLAEFEAFGDPARKKSFYLLGLLRNECGWQYHDPEHLGAPVDYHEVRGHLRLGTVRVLDRRLEAQLKARAWVDGRADLAIRTAVSRAIDAIAAAAGSTDALTLHYLFWNLFRSCCGRDATHCSTCGPGCALPPRYRLGAEGCGLAAVCTSRGAPVFIEHQHDTDFY